MFADIECEDEDLQDYVLLGDEDRLWSIVLSIKDRERAGWLTR